MTIGIIGTGNMGGILVRAFTKSGNRQVFVFDMNKVKLEEICAETGAETCQSGVELAQKSQLIVVAVKPNIISSVLEEIKREITAEKIVLSIAAGVEILLMADILGHDKKIVRTLPNTPAMVGEGMTLVSYNDQITRQEKDAVTELLSSAGKVQEFPESLMTEATALTSSSPAYVYLFIEAMADAAVLSGIPRDLAYPLAAQAVLGSAKMVLETGMHPGELKDAVCSPGGTTIAAVAKLEENGLRSAVIEAMNACTQVARGIGKK